MLRSRRSPTTSARDAHASDVKALLIQRVDVGSEDIEALVRVTDPELVRTSSVPHVTERMLCQLPGLVRHRCECGTGRGMVAELRDTETPHLLEHAALEIMALAGSPRSLRGETVWDFERDGRYVFRVRLEYDDDLVAIGALRVAVTLLDAAIRGEPGPEIRSEVDRLRALRESEGPQSSSSRE